jgi:1-phosphofructokinase family hexose kinase
MTILCVTPNPAIDRTLTVHGFAAGGVWRATAMRAACGGKGVNVARALLRLGRSAICAGPLAGLAGRQAAALAEAEGLPARWTWVDGETRTCVIIVGGAGVTTVINEPGPWISQCDWRRLLVDVEDLAATCSAICISGSLPPGCRKGALAALIRAVRDRSSAPLWLDTSGAALVEAMAAAPAGIKINAEEAAALLRRPIRNAGEALGAARHIHRRGVQTVAITLGVAGAVLAGRSGDWEVAAPAIEPLNPVGSGDCFLAGLLAGIVEGNSEAETLRLAVACGAANAATAHAGEFDPATVWMLHAETVVSPAVSVDRA